MSRAWLRLFPPPASTNDPLAVQPVIDAKARPQINPQFKHAAAHGFEIAKISGAHAGQSGIHRRLPFFVAEGIEPLVKRDKSVLKLQLLDFPLDHRRSVIYR